MVGIPVRTTRHSEANEWTTPRWLYDALAERIPFTVDLCATADNALAPRFGFGSVRPGDRAFLNPPYGRELTQVLRVAVDLVGLDGLANLVALLPVRTSVAWWHHERMRSRQTVYIRGRLRFGGSTVNAPFDSAVVVFGTAPRIRRIVALKGQEHVEWEA